MIHAMLLYRGAYYIMNKNLKTLLEQQMVDCSQSQGNGNSNRGRITYSFKYMMSNKIERESTYPYTGQNGPCSHDPAKRVIKIQTYKTAASILLKLRPVSLGIIASTLKHYKSGIVQESQCMSGNNHAVLLVGLIRLPEVLEDQEFMGHELGREWNSEIRVSERYLQFAKDPRYPVL